MADNEIAVMALPLSTDDDEGMSLECSLCGPVGIVPFDEAEQQSIAHIKSHGGTFLEER